MTMHNDSSNLSFLDFVDRIGPQKLTNAEYDLLRTLAEKHLTYQALFQLLSAKLPCKPGVRNAWKLLGDCIMCSDEEADKRRKLEYETELRMRSAKIKHDREQQHKHEEREQAIAAVLRQQHKLQRIADELQQSTSDFHDLLSTLQ